MSGKKLFVCSLCLALFSLGMGQSLSYLELEAKLHPQHQRIAGTLSAQVRGALQPDVWSLPAGLEVIRIAVNEQPATFRIVPGGFTIQAPASQRNTQRISILFSGTGTTSALDFHLDEDGHPWIKLSDAGAQAWHPSPPAHWEKPDSMWASLILPEPLRPVTNGRLATVTPWPGGDQKWAFQQALAENGKLPDWFVGNYVRFTNMQQGEGGLQEWQFWVPKSRLEAAQVHYAEVPSILKVLERHWGPAPSTTTGSRRWIEAPGANLHGSRLYGRKAPGYSPVLVREVASFWLGPLPVPGESPVREALFQYAEWLWIESQSSEVVRQNTLESYRTQPDLWGAWLFQHWATQGTPSWSRTWSLLLSTARQPGATDSQLRQLLAREGGQETDISLRQYLDRKSMPVMEFMTEKRRRKWVLRYRWINVERGFSWPVEVLHHGEVMLLHPTDQWQEKDLPKGGGRSLMIDESQGLFEILAK